MALLLLFATFAIFLFAADGYSIENLRVRRFLHGCPFAFPCPLPPCDNPVFGPHDCCGSCPEPKPETTTTTTATTVRAPKIRSEIKENAELKVKAGVYLRKLYERSENSRTESRLEYLQKLWSTTTFPTTSFCPNPCTHHGYHYCHPLPCYINCVDAVKRPGACCYECLNGKNALIINLQFCKLYYYTFNGINHQQSFFS